MNENTNSNHNIIVTIITIASLGAVIESLTQGWELWVPPLILVGIIGIWFIHITKQGSVRFREDFYLIFSMVEAFYHGVHRTSFFDIIVISVLLMVVATLVKRDKFLNAALAEFFILMIIHIIWNIRLGGEDFDSLVISRICLHCVGEVGVFKTLKSILKSSERMEEELIQRNREEETDRIGMEDFLVNISHELRTPVNVINGMSSLILKKEDREDVISIRDAGLRLSHQIEDIQDYSEIQRGDCVLEEENYMITSIVNDIATNYELLGKIGDLELIIDLDPDVPATMYGDAAKIKKIIAHLLDNAFKFSKTGGVYLHIYAVKKDYGVNLAIEVIDTGIGMTQSEIARISRGRYQANEKRNRNTGGIGLGLSIVYGFTRAMKGFVSIESKKKKGTSVRVNIVQVVTDPKPCLSITSRNFMNVVFHVVPEKYKVSALREFYKKMASNMASGLRVNLYSAPSIAEVKRLMERGDITHLFMGAEEYMANGDYFDELAKNGINVAVSAASDFRLNPGSMVIMMPKPLYGLPVMKVLNGELQIFDTGIETLETRVSFNGIKALIVDDEPMNLVVASGLFKEYDMEIDTALSGLEAIRKFEDNKYDIVFMDHMMPEMDGVEAMKRIRFTADQQGKKCRMIALTANAISGAREMFLAEGFDGFISKPINVKEFERVMGHVMADYAPVEIGGAV